MLNNKKNTLRKLQNNTKSDEKGTKRPKETRTTIKTQNKLREMSHKKIKTFPNDHKRTENRFITTACSESNNRMQINK